MCQYENEEMYQPTEEEETVLMIAYDEFKAAADQKIRGCEDMDNIEGTIALGRKDWSIGDRLLEFGFLEFIENHWPEDDPNWEWAQKIYCITEAGIVACHQMQRIFKNNVASNIRPQNTIWVIVEETTDEQWCYNHYLMEEARTDVEKRDIVVQQTTEDMMLYVTKRHAENRDIEFDIQQHIIGGSMITTAFFDLEGKLTVRPVDIV